jgi:GDP-mannose 6-dehydrogenase
MGYVGVVSGACLAREGHHVLGVDINPQKIEFLRTGVSPIVEVGIAELIREVVDAGRLEATTDPEEAIERSDVTCVCVGTPSAPNGSLSLKAMDAVTRQIGAALRAKRGEHTVVYRSTILPGTTNDRLLPALEEAAGRRVGEGLHVAYNPEFLREGCSIHDFDHPPMTVVGSETEEGYARMEEMYAALEAEFVRTSIRVAESVKYLCNIYHALKIVFANEAGVVLREAGVDARDALEIFCKDRILNISEAYLKPGYAFGGSCLPKDMRAFFHLAKSRDLDLPMLSGVMPSNQQHIEHAYRLIAQHGRRRLALFGLAFKGGTDDLRESPIVTLAERLIGKGYELKIYDPNVNTSRLIGANKAYIEKEIPHLDRLLQGTPAATLEGAEAVVLANLEPTGIDALLAAPPQVPVIDLQGIREIARLPGLDYTGICW